MSERHTDIPCPICGGNRLRQPWIAGDYPDWDCLDCGLDVPNSVFVDGASIIAAMAKPELREALVAIVPNLNWIEKQ